MSLIIDSSYASLEEAIRGSATPEDVSEKLSLITLRYLSFDQMLHQGQMVVHRNLAKEVIEIFEELLALRFPIKKVVPIIRYSFDDDASMADNNSSSQNYRVIAGTNRLSYHADGTALDINPVQNPFCKTGKNDPAGRLYNPKAPGTLFEGSAAVECFLRRGWIWGGRWTTPVDYQHFQKPQ